jgi:hypothetical protein
MSRARGWVAEEWGSIPRRGERYFLLHSVQTVSGAHPASYPMSTGDISPKGKAADQWSWLLICV